MNIPKYILFLSHVIILYVLILHVIIMFFAFHLFL